MDDEVDFRFKRVTSKRRRLNFETRCRIIEERFGSYGGQYSIGIQSVCDIARKLALKHPMVSYHIRRYVKNKGRCNNNNTIYDSPTQVLTVGLWTPNTTSLNTLYIIIVYAGFLMANPDLMPRRRNTPKMTKEIIDYATDRAVLKQWAHLSLRERVIKIHEKFQTKITQQCLGFWYRRNGIRWRRPNYKMLGALKRATLLKEQAEWSWQLTTYMQRGFEIIYIDETSSHLWDQKGKVWQPNDDSIFIHRPSTRGHSVTIIAGLSSNGGVLQWQISRSTNKEDFLHFLKSKVHPFVKYPRSTVLVMDNHRAHHSLVVSKWLQEKSYIVHFLPPYSSELNPIETVWALLKQQWGKTLTSQGFEDKMLKISNQARSKKDEFNYDSDGELVLSTKQKMCQRELEKGLVHILIWHMTPEKLKKIAKGCRRQMMKVMLIEKEATLLNWS